MIMDSWRKKFRILYIFDDGIANIIKQALFLNFGD